MVGRGHHKGSELNRSSSPETLWESCSSDTRNRRSQGRDYNKQLLHINFTNVEDDNFI